MSYVFIVAIIVKCARCVSLRVGVVYWCMLRFCNALCVCYCVVVCPCVVSFVVLRSCIPMWFIVVERGPSGLWLRFAVCHCAVLRPLVVCCGSVWSRVVSGVSGRFVMVS